MNETVEFVQVMPLYILRQLFFSHRRRGTTSAGGAGRGRAPCEACHEMEAGDTTQKIFLEMIK